MRKADGGLRTTRSERWPSGEVRERVKPAPSNSTEKWYYANDGRPSMRTRSGAEDQSYSYDANGNRTTDERGSYVYNARDKVVAWTRSRGPEGVKGKLVEYEPNGAGATVEKIDAASAEGGGGTTSYTYVGEELKKTVFQGKTLPGAPKPPEPVVATYAYDDFGNVSSVDQDDNDPATPSVAKTEFSHDEFGRMKSGKTPKDGAPQQTTEESFSYDALDRRDAKTTDGKSYDLSYVGSSEGLSRETPTSGEARSYDRDSEMQVTGVAKGTDGSPNAYRAYAKDANGSIEGLEKDGGGIAENERYDYDPYGELQFGYEFSDLEDIFMHRSPHRIERDLGR